MQNQNDTIEVTEWVRRGSMLVNRHALDWDDPDHMYNHIASMGKNPEDYGIKHPLNSQFEGKSRSELIAEILQLRKEITGWARADAAGFIGRR